MFLSSCLLSTLHYSLCFLPYPLTPRSSASGATGWTLVCLRASGPEVFSQDFPLWPHCALMTTLFWKFSSLLIGTLHHPDFPLSVLFCLFHWPAFSLLFPKCRQASRFSLSSSFAYTATLHGLNSHFSIENTHLAIFSSRLSTELQTCILNNCWLSVH